MMPAPLRLATLWALVAAAMTTCGCAVPIHVNAYAERGTDMERYRTFDFAPPEQVATGDPRLDSNPFFNERLQAAAQKALEAKGYERATSDTSDLRLHFHVSISQDIIISDADRRFCEPGNCRPFVYDAGMLLMDLVDVAANRLVWRGWAERRMEGVVDTQAWMEQRVDDEVARIIGKLPRRAPGGQVPP